VLDAGLDPADAPGVLALARGLDMDVGPPVLVGGRDVTEAIRTAEVSGAVSVVAAVPEVRVILVAAQREWIEVHGGGVVEGRDIGTVVAPDALLKIYLVASEEERARRRLRQDSETGDPDTGDLDPGDLDTTQAAIRRRDALDSGRAASPLAAADDAVVLDTTDLSVDGVVAEVLRRYRAALEQAERA
jgi:cytidylate kinase